MRLNHAIGQWVFAVAVGLAVAVAAHRWITDPAPREERALQERVVLAARHEIGTLLELERPELVDPLAPNRKVGKTYVYRAGDGWEVSGYYRRHDEDDWHPYLAKLNAMLALEHLKVQDPAFEEASRTDSRLDAVP